MSSISVKIQLYFNQTAKMNNVFCNLMDTFERILAVQLK